MVSQEKPLLATSAAESRMHRLVWLASAAFAAAMFWNSATRWANFSYRTFDLAYYVQALWRLVHGHGDTVSLLNVPLLGEHASVIVYFMVPLAAVLPHPLLPVAVQILALASMGPVAYRIARRLGLEPETAGLLALAGLLTPGAGFVAIHEFHPEALAAPFLLLAIDAYQRQSLPRFWLWFLATLACKENMTLLLFAWCAMNAWDGERVARKYVENSGQASSTTGKSPWVLRWCIAPGLVALAWAGVYAGVLMPWLNAGNVDFGVLYTNVLDVPLREMPHAVQARLAESLQGTLWLGLLLPLCGLSLLRLRWLLVAAPVAFQHLLSFRSSEWNIWAHYAAPLLPLVWVAACEAVAGVTARGAQKALACGMICACVATQLWLGPVRGLLYPGPGLASETGAAEAALASVPANASVAAGLPFLSHLAQRDSLVSLHHIIKGLKTLSLKPYYPPEPAEVVIVDYADTATFDAEAGYYHVQMRVVGGLIVPTSDQLFNTYLRRATWDVESCNSFTVFRRRATSPVSIITAGAPSQEPIPEGPLINRIDPATTLINIIATPQENGRLKVESLWRFTGERKTVPWMELEIAPIRGKSRMEFVRGLCVPEAWANGVDWTDRWTVAFGDDLPPGEYQLVAVFFDNARLLWDRRKNPAAKPDYTVRVNLGTVRVP